MIIQTDTSISNHIDILSPGCSIQRDVNKLSVIGNCSVGIKKRTCNRELCDSLIQDRTNSTPVVFQVKEKKKAKKSLF